MRSAVCLHFCWSRFGSQASRSLQRKVAQQQGLHFTAQAGRHWQQRRFASAAEHWFRAPDKALKTRPGPPRKLSDVLGVQTQPQQQERPSPTQRAPSGISGGETDSSEAAGRRAGPSVRSSQLGPGEQRDSGAPAEAAAALSEAFTSSRSSDGTLVLQLKPPSKSREQIRREKSLQSCKDMGFRLVARRPHSRHELQSKMASKERYEPDIIEEALDRLEELDVIDDTEFAKLFAHTKWRHYHWAPARISMALAGLGVSKADVSIALDALAGEIEEAEAQAVDAGHDVDMPGAGAVLMEGAARHMQTMHNAPLETRRRRMAHWLQRRGHSWRTVSSVLSELGLDFS